MFNKPTSGRYFMLGGDYFRGQFNDGLSPQDLVVDLNNAVLSGMNTVRFYGFPGMHSSAHLQLYNISKTQSCMN